MKKQTKAPQVLNIWRYDTMAILIQIWKFTYQRILTITILGLVFDFGLVTLANERIYRSAYFLGRGDTGVAIADGSEAIHYNPAGLAQGKGVYKETVLVSPMVELSTATKDLIRKFALEQSTGADTLAEEMGKNQHFGANNLSAVVFRRAAIGATISNQTDLLPRLSKDQGALPVVSAFSATNQSLHFSLAEQFFSKSFTLGTTLKYVSRSVASIDIALAESSDLNERLSSDSLLNTGTGTGFDLGMMYRGQSKRAPFSLGLQVVNVGGLPLKGVTDQDEVDDLNQTINIGFAIEPGTKFSRFRLLLDVRDLAGETEPNNLKKVNIGTEIAIRKFIGVTSGLHHGYPTFGTFINIYVLRMDLGMYTEEVGDRIGERPDNRFYMRLTAGF